MLLSDEFKDTIIREVKIESLKILTQRDNDLEISITSNVCALIGRSLGYDLLEKDRVKEIIRDSVDHIEVNLDDDDRIPGLLFEYLKRIICQEIKLDLALTGLKNF